MQKRLRCGKRALAIVLILVMSLGLIQMAAAADYDEHWSKEFIDDAKTRGWMNGYEDGSFRPDGSITRAEFAVMLWRALGEPEPEGESPFSDVDADEWYGKAVIALYEQKIVNGVGEGLFAPGSTLTREMGFTMMARAFGIVSEGDEYTEFADSEEISEWARAAVSALCKKGYINGTGDNLSNPQSPLKRGEMAKLLTVVYDGEEAEEPGEPTTPSTPHVPSGPPAPPTPPTEYTVTFDANGGTLTGDETATVEENKPVTKPSDPTNYTEAGGNAVGRKFDGWYCNGTEWNFDTPVTQDGIVLTAKWGATVILEELAGFQDITVKIEGVATLEQSAEYSVMFDGREMNFKVDYEGYRIRIDLEGAAAPKILAQMAKITISSTTPEPPEPPEFIYKSAISGSLMGEVLLSAALEGITSVEEANKWRVYYVLADGTSQIELTYNASSTLFVGTAHVRTASDVDTIDTDPAVAAAYMDNIKCEPRMV